MNYTIDDYKKMFVEAQARGDSATMKYANDGANAIRLRTGQKLEDASSVIRDIAYQQQQGTFKPTTPDYSYLNKPQTPVTPTNSVSDIVKKVANNLSNNSVTNNNSSYVSNNNTQSNYNNNSSYVSNNNTQSNYNNNSSNTKSYDSDMGFSNQTNNLVTNFSPNNSGGYNTYVVLPNGTRVSGSVNNGVTTLADGSRPPVGSTVSTKDGFYTVGSSGSYRTTYGDLVGGYFGYTGGAKTPVDHNLNKQKMISDFFYDNPDISSYLLDKGIDYDKDTSFDIILNGGVYAGQLPELRDRFVDWYSRADANAVRGSTSPSPTTSNKQKAISSAINRYSDNSSSFNYRPEGTVSSFDSYDVPVYSDFLTSRTSTVPQNSNNVIVLNPNNPQAGIIYEAYNGRFLDINGQRVKLSDDEYINMMAKYLGF